LSYINSLKKDALRTAEVNVGRLVAGDRAGAVPDEAEAHIRVLFDAGASWKDLLRTIQREAAAFAKSSNSGNRRFRITATPAEFRTNPGAVPWDAPACRVLRDSIWEVTGQHPSSYPNHYGGDIRYPIRLLGAPAFGVGPIAGNFYGPNEWVDVDDLVRMVAVIIRTIQGWTKDLS
jgi:acetylornithine deacetylase/succinyl-diaminopimelate desuccinylase-like protein